ncbi:MAG: UDP-2,3-diacylglucosamine diphosphatase LpxI [Desulfamplus sp.]|nr:UDP-2,3-diacylglucosamine diphosphatase LpxI [Desulfamplus sp.]
MPKIKGKIKIQSHLKRIGVIAGGGQFPTLFSKKAAAKGYQVFAAAYLNEADTALEQYVNGIEWVHLGQVSKLIQFFKKNSISEAVMMGSVKKTRIFKDIKPDLKAIKFIASRGKLNTHDDGILRSFADLLEKEGISIKPSTFLLPELISPKGCWTKKKPDQAELKDIEIGWRVAREIGRLDIGQCVVVANGTVLAVEGADGTDATIKRGALLANRGGDREKHKLGSRKGVGVVVVKLCKPIQDFRFDLPASGIETVRVMAEFNASNASVLVLEAGRSISFDRDEMIAFADQHNISISAMEDCDFK